MINLVHSYIRSVRSMNYVFFGDVLLLGLHFKSHKRPDKIGHQGGRALGSNNFGMSIKSLLIESSIESEVPDNMLQMEVF